MPASSSIYVFVSTLSLFLISTLHSTQDMQYAQQLPLANEDQFLCYFYNDSNLTSITSQLPEPANGSHFLFCPEYLSESDSESDDESDEVKNQKKMRKALLCYRMLNKGKGFIIED